MFLKRFIEKNHLIHSLLGSKVSINNYYLNTLTFFLRTYSFFYIKSHTYLLSTFEINLGNVDFNIPTIYIYLHIHLKCIFVYDYIFFFLSTIDFAMYIIFSIKTYLVNIPKDSTMVLCYKQEGRLY